jgi:DNA-binding LacI/PurR family transcriptional regulator
MINVTVTLRPTIRQVAERAGVSRMTVSRVLGGHDDLVSETTRQRVLAAVRELEYIPVVQRVTQSRRVETRIIGLVFDGTPFEGPFGLATFIGLREGAKEYDYDLLTLIRDVPKWMLGKEELQFLNRRCDGIIFVSPHERYKTVETLMQHNIPVVCCHTNDVPKQAPCVIFDNFGAMYQMTEYLISQGHRHIMHVGSCTERSDFAAREEGYRKAMLDARLQPVVFNLDYKNDRLVRGFFEQIERNNITALNCVSDTQAFCAWDIAMVRGINIPQEISITGMDNVQKEVISRGLATVAISLEQSGKQAFEVMMKLMKEGYWSVEDVTLPFQIIKRTSVRNIT